MLLCARVIILITYSIPGMNVQLYVVLTVLEATMLLWCTAPFPECMNFHIETLGSTYHGVTKWAIKCSLRSSVLTLITMTSCNGNNDWQSQFENADSLPRCIPPLWYRGTHKINLHVNYRLFREIHDTLVNYRLKYPLAIR